MFKKLFAILRIFYFSFDFIQLSTYLFSSLLIQIQELQKKQKTLDIIQQNFTALLNAPQISNNDINRTVASTLQH
ncbi:hypothetical protein DW656_11525 [Coprococcus comes]|uniref:Uncharacterized protein n=1 Tax=Coprococcus comes TaxID=410072 RepID=A0A3R6GEJ4_9FIRM|nr:hypothetical protein DW656_11525 [Coprococcus comes]